MRAERPALRTIVGKVVWILPVDHTAGPLDSTLRHGRDTSRPDGELNACRSRGVLIHAVLECVGLLDAAHFLVVNEETEDLRLPVDSIIVVVCISISQAGMGLAVSSGIWSHWHYVMTIRQGQMGRRTINVAFEEEVRLDLCRLRTRPFPINFVLDVAHRDERSHDASPSAGL